MKLTEQYFTMTCVRNGLNFVAESGTRNDSSGSMPMADDILFFASAVPSWRKNGSNSSHVLFEWRIYPDGKNFVNLPGRK